MSNVMLKLCLLSILMVFFSASASADWKDLWKTPQQQALQAYEKGEYEALIQDAPDDSWSALGQFQTKDYQQASESFAARVEQLRAAGDNEAATRALYNQGVSDVMAGQFESAIERFDEALVEDPSLDAAQRNRDVAQQLLELQQKNESEQNGEQGEEGEEGEQGEPGEDGEPSEQQGEPGDGEQSADQSGEPGESDDEKSAGQSAQDDPSASGSEGEDDTDPADLSEAQEQQDAEDAREALAAEAAQAAQQDADDEQGSEESAAERITERPLSEAEQATEQLLRRIPDDPAGLLRRKLEQSHRSEYPEVRNAAEPW